MVPAPSGNWRKRDSDELFVEPVENNIDYDDNIESACASENDDDNQEYPINVIQASDFDNDLVWDVKLDVQDNNDNRSSRVISPRLLANIGNKKISVLLDSGSEVTCISESLYEELKNIQGISELPVSNIAVLLAIGKKRTTIKKQVQLKFMIGTLEFEYIFLVVSGLSSEILVGIDWLYHFSAIIDLKNKKISLKGKNIPDNLVLFNAYQKIENKKCSSISLVKGDKSSKSSQIVDSIKKVNCISNNSEGQDLISLINLKVDKLIHLSKNERDIVKK